jgi:acyl carrier protein
MTVTEIRTADQDAQLRDRVREIMAETFGLDAPDLTEDTSQSTCAKWTSLYHMMLLVVLEEQFGVSFALDEMTTMTSLQQIVAVLKGHGVHS